MAQRSAIEWTDATVNFWWGCTKVGPGCDHCYAEAWSRRTGGEHWGLGVPRRKIASAAALIHRLDNDYANWAADRECGLCGPHASISRRVFIQSMSDLFDLEVPLEWFAEAWGLIKVCNRIEIQIVTKRISVVEKRLAEIGETTWPKHAGLIITVVNQAEADRDVPRLLALKIKLGIPWVGLSCEPLLGPIDARPWLGGNMGCESCDDGHPAPPRCQRDDIPREEQCPEKFCVFDTEEGPLDEDGTPGWINEKQVTLDWVIVGGESGTNARPMHPDWARSLRDHCAATGVPFLFKQWGNHKPFPLTDNRQIKRSKFYLGGRGFTFHQVEGYALVNVGKKGAGRLLDGVEHNEFPKVPA